MLRLSTALLTVALCCALTLALIYHKTSPRIEEQKQMLLEKSLNSVLEAQKYKKQESEEVYFKAYDDKDKLLGWCLALSGKGYGGEISLLVGIDTKYKVKGVKVLEHKETPGLGSQISDLKYQQTESDFLAQFKEKVAKEIILVKGQSEEGIQAITGATISSRAVAEAVKEGIENFIKLEK